MNTTIKALVMLGLLLLAVAVLSVAIVARAFEQAEKAGLASARIAELQLTVSAAEADLSREEPQRDSFAGLVQAWEAQSFLKEGEKASALVMRTSLESLAQKRLGLVTDQLVSPESAKVQFGRRTVHVQRVSLRVSGESLASLLVWLGEAEAAFPFARVETLEIVSTGAGCALRLGLAQALEFKSQNEGRR